MCGASRAAMWELLMQDDTEGYWPVASRYLNLLEQNFSVDELQSFLIGTIVRKKW